VIDSTMDRSFLSLRREWTRFEEKITNLKGADVAAAPHYVENKAGV
jgi:hypothetical protein